MWIERYESDGRWDYVVWNDFGSRVIGNAVIERKRGTTVLDKINVSRTRRGEGVGSELLNQILQDFESDELVAYAFEGRVGWYLRHGFEPVGKRGLLVKVRRPSSN